LEIKVKLKLDALQDSENIADLIEVEALRNIGSRVLQTYQADKSSRDRWEKQMEEAEKLALQISEPKSYPWPNSSNVKFPLITIAAMQFQARAYPALVKVPDLVKWRVQGKDGGEKAARSARVSAHMSYQLLEEDEGWEEDHDKALLALPILGCVFKKSYYDKLDKHNRSPLVLPKNLVVHYFAKSIENCERKTEIFELYPNEIKERQLRKIFRDVELSNSPIAQPKDSDRRQGITPPAPDEDSARPLLEQHCYYDLDGDGYKEPYIITVDEATGEVLRIVNRFGKITTEQSIKIEELTKRIKALAEGIQPPQEGVAPSPQELAIAQRAEQTIRGMSLQIELLAKQTPKVLKIDPVEYYTKYSFIPAPDGGFYDLGFGALLGPLNDSVNTLINQLVDAGHMNTGAIGFIGKGARIQGGRVRFQPNEMKKLNAAGGAIRDAIVQLDIKPPSPVLFQLLGLLISYSERVGSVTDAMTGENPGQNTPAYNMSAMLEQGLQVFNGIFKRVYRSMRSEFRKLYNLNSIYLDQESYFSYHDSDTQVLRLDYSADPKDLIPAADPNAFSNKEKTQKAMMITERAQMVPGYNPILIEKNWLESIEAPNAKELYPTQIVEGAEQLMFPPQPDPKLELEKADLQRKTLEGKTRNDIETQKAQTEMMLAEARVMEMMGKLEVEQDKSLIAKLQLQLDDMISKREALTDIAVAQIKAQSEEKKVEAQKAIASKRPATGSKPTGTK